MTLRADNPSMGLGRTEHSAAPAATPNAFPHKKSPPNSGLFHDHAEAPKRHSDVPIYFNSALSKLPISAGLRVILKPHSSMMASLASAVSAPPEMRAPAWPMRLPGGAVTPAMKPTTGFFMLAFTHIAVSSGAPIEPRQFRVPAVITDEIKR